MRIVYVTSSTGVQGGAELCLLKLAQHFSPNVLVLLPAREGIAEAYERAQIPTAYIPMLRMRRTSSFVYQLRYLWMLLLATARIVLLLRKNRPDVIHTNEFIDLPGLLAGRILGIHTVCHVRTIIEQPVWFKQLITTLIWYLADQVICVSDAVRQAMFSSQPRFESKTQVIYDGGPDLAVFNPELYDQCQIRSQVGLGADTIVVCLVSKFVEVKGHDHLVKAAHLLSVTGSRTFLYMLVGGIVDGHEAYYKYMQQLVEGLGLGDVVLFAGYRSDVPALLAACDIVVHLPLYQEPFPGVVLEAMAMEKPVVAYRSGGILEQVDDQVSGVLIPQGNVELLAAAIATLANDPELRKCIGRQARKDVLARFSLDRHFGAVAAVYDSICSQSTCQHQ